MRAQRTARERRRNNPPISPSRARGRSVKAPYARGARALYRARPLLLGARSVTRSANPARLNHDRDRHEHDDEVVPQRLVIENVDDEQRECGENHYPVRPRVADAVGTDHSAAICEVGPCLPLLWVGHAAASIARAHRAVNRTPVRPSMVTMSGPRPRARLALLLPCDRVSFSPEALCVGDTLRGCSVA